MPVMSGIEATKILRKKIKNREIQNTTIIALSAKDANSEEDESFYKNNEFDSYLSKPVSRRDIEKVLTQYNLI
jgi:CheY-like chemotaxis protein